jgi:F-type H+-transporting ATPase subunit gamma
MLNYGGNVLAEVTKLGDAPTMASLIGVIKTLLDNYRDAKLDAIYLAYNVFINTMTQTPTIVPLLPLISTKEEKSHRWDYIYEPDAKSLLDLTLTRYIESQVYQAVVENVACKQAAQMVAMKSATDNAGKIIDGLKLAYNKARQSAITAELAEIVAGAEAV